MRAVALPGQRSDVVTVAAAVLADGVAGSGIFKKDLALEAGGFRISQGYHPHPLKPYPRNPDTT